MSLKANSSLVVMPQWSLEHRQTPMQLTEATGDSSQAENGAIRKEREPVLSKEVVGKPETIECVIQCPEEAVWEVKVNETTCGGVKHISTGEVLEIHVKIQLHAQQTHEEENRKHEQSEYYGNI